jgi:hypothetical protein
VPVGQRRLEAEYDEGEAYDDAGVAKVFCAESACQGASMRAPRFGMNFSPRHCWMTNEEYLKCYQTVGWDRFGSMSRTRF